ncbi:MAG: amidohydrolase family protein [Ramlibacter sp.]
MKSEASMGGANAHSAGENRPALAVPTGACDCHMHVFDKAYPVAADAVLRHPDAGLEGYRGLQHRLGVQRHVIVQPSIYGLDNSLLVNALAAAASLARGVAVVDDAVSDEELRFLSSRGVAGTRFNLVQRGATRLGMLESVARRIEPLGWHVQLHLEPADLLEHHALIARLPVPVVLDHWARVALDASLQPDLLACIDRLLEAGNTWIKLSGAYLATRSSAPHDDLGVCARRWADRRPDRLLWGTDWPHATEAVKPNDADLLDLLAHWLPDAVTRQRVLVDNPQRLYGFDVVAAAA